MDKFFELLAVTVFFSMLAGLHFLILYNLAIGLTLFLGLYSLLFFQVLFKGDDKNNDNRHTTNPV